MLGGVLVLGDFWSEDVVFPSNLLCKDCAQGDNCTKIVHKIVHKETMKRLCSSLCWGARNSNTIVKMLSFQVTYYAKIVHKETIVQRLCTRRQLYKDCAQGDYVEFFFQKLLAWLCLGHSPSQV